MSSVRQDGTSDWDFISIAVATEGGSTVLAGSTYGSWNDTDSGSSDFAAVKLDADGTVEWKWQVNGKREVVPKELQGSKSHPAVVGRYITACILVLCPLVTRQ